MKRAHRNSKKAHAVTQKVIAEAAYEVKDKFAAVQDGLMSYAKKNPLKTVGISLLTGMAIAQLLRLRK